MCICSPEWWEIAILSLHHPHISWTAFCLCWGKAAKCGNVSCRLWENESSEPWAKHIRAHGFLGSSLVCLCKRHASQLFSVFLSQISKQLQDGCGWFVCEVCGSWLDAQYHMTSKMRKRERECWESRKRFYLLWFAKSCSQIRFVTLSWHFTRSTAGPRSAILTMRGFL